jgi:hypothetical protein
MVPVMIHLPERLAEPQSDQVSSEGVQNPRYANLSPEHI